LISGRIPLRDFSLLALSSEDMRDIGDGLLTILPEPVVKRDPEERVSAKKATSTDGVLAPISIIDIALWQIKKF
jgi:hypothetical protein